MDFITTGGILGCMALLWTCNLLMLRLIRQLEEKVEALEYPQSEQRCQHCRWKMDCPAYDTGPCYPCKHFEEVDDETKI